MPIQSAAVVNGQDDEHARDNTGPADDDTSGKDPADRYPRLVGLGLVLLSGAVVKWQVYDPLLAAQRGQSHIWISGKLVTVGIGLGLLGVAFLLLGKRVTRWFKTLDPQHIGWKPALALGGLAIVSLAIYIVVELTLAAHGYSRSEF
jgi:hypothetical protein